MDSVEHLLMRRLYGVSENPGRSGLFFFYVMYGLCVTGEDSEELTFGPNSLGTFTLPGIWTRTPLKFFFHGN